MKYFDCDCMIGLTKVPLPDVEPGLDDLLPEMWRFCKDPEKVVEKEQWFSPQKRKDDWQLISTHKFWDESIGLYEQGDGWYAVDLTIGTGGMYYG